MITIKSKIRVVFFKKIETLTEYLLFYFTTVRNMCIAQGIYDMDLPEAEAEGYIAPQAPKFAPPLTLFVLKQLNEKQNVFK